MYSNVKHKLFNLPKGHPLDIPRVTLSQLSEMLDRAYASDICLSVEHIDGLVPIVQIRNTNSR